MTWMHCDAVLSEVDELGRRFVDAGWKLYLVGGIVRDLWLDHDLSPASDIDLTTDARPPDIKGLIGDLAEAVWLQGERFGTIGAQLNGRAMEITTHRAEVYRPDSRKPEVAFGDRIEDDLARRDFTVNAMALRVPDGELIDPFGGVADLEAGVLRTPLDPDVSFTDDPLRMMRAARFTNRFGLVPDPALLDSASRLADRIDIVAVERVRDELDKLLGAPEVAVGLDLLERTGLLGRVVPGAGAASVELASRTPAPWWLRLAALILPVVEEESAPVRPLTNRLRLSKEDRSNVERALALTASLGGIGAVVADPQVRGWVGRAGEHAESIWMLAEQRWGSDRLRLFRERWDELAEVEDLQDRSQPLDGHAISEILGISPGPVLGEAVSVLDAERLRVGPLSVDAAELVLRDWWAARPAG